jgi:hypothetical protein
MVSDGLLAIPMTASASGQFDAGALLVDEENASPPAI